MADQRQEEAADDAVMTRIGQAVMLHRGGDREEARNRFAQLWQELGERGDAFHRCTLAHYMADTQDDPADELVWDLRALEAADAISYRWLRRRHTTRAVRAFYPSLYLNVAADYVKLRRNEEARTQLDRARHASAALSDNGYADGIRAAIGRLELRLAGGGAGEPAPPPGHWP